MTFMRVKELEAQVAKLKKDLRNAEVEGMLMEKYLQQNGLMDDFMKMAELELREVHADMLRAHFKVINPE